MELPFDPMLEAIASSTDAGEAWRKCCALAGEASPHPMWSDLAALNAAADVDACLGWLQAQLTDADDFLLEVDQSAANGVVIWLDPQALEEGEQWCLEIGACAECEPEVDAIDWVEQCPWSGELFMPPGLGDAAKIWTAVDASDVRDAMEYTSFVFYTGALMLYAAEQIKRDGPLLVAWGFQDGDQGLLWRATAAGSERLLMLAGE